MNRLSNPEIKELLTNFRNQLRDGCVTVSYKSFGPVALRQTVAQALGIQDADAFNTDNFNPQTLKRFAKLFDVPYWPNTAALPEYDFTYPSQDETATAIQNFMNRRFDPWAHMSVSASEADPIASEVQANS